MSTVTAALDGDPKPAAPVTSAGRGPLSLRKETFIMVAGALVALIVILSVSLSWILVARFSRVEKQDAALDLQASGAALSDYLNPLRISASDWSARDVAYQFVENGNAAYRQTNLAAFDLTLLQVDLIAYVQPDGHITYGTSVDRANGTLHPLPDSLTSLLTSRSLLVRAPSANQKISGFLSLPQGTLLVVADPIVHDDGSGPSRGALILGRFLTPADLATVRAEKEVRIKSLTLEPTSAPDLSATTRSAIRRLAAGSKTVEQPVNSGLMLASMTVSDVFGKPTFILQAGIDRSTYQQAQMALHYVVLALVVIGGIFLGLVLLLLERLVLRRLARVSQGVQSIAARRDPTMRLAPERADEIGQLASTINQMLQALENARDREHHLNEQIAELHIQIDEARRDNEVQRITDSDYFRDLTERAEHLRRRNSQAPNVTD